MVSINTEAITPSMTTVADPRADEREDVRDTRGADERATASNAGLMAAVSSLLRVR